MLRYSRRALSVAAAVTLVAGCNNYFEGEKVDKNPNVPSTAEAGQLFVAFQAFGFYNLTGDVNRLLSAWMRHMAGTGRQWALYDAGYEVTENDFVWDGYYTGGGLVDLRTIQNKVKDDKFYLGVAQVWEALEMDLVADVWGDIPYSEAVNPDIRSPKLDKAVDVHNALITLVDAAIANINGAGNGPGGADLVYSGNKPQWLQAARTLKARMLMHLGEVDQTAYARALTETASGISSESNDFTTYQSGTTGEQNHWFQFRLQRGTDLGAGEFLVNLMKARNDPRLEHYFSPGPSAGGEIIGAPPGEEDDGTFAWLSDGERGSPEFRQPVLTFAENQMIRAEAQFRTGGTAAALTTLNAFRQTVGLPARTGLTGSALLTAIMEEKYVSLFQNIEVWNDYKRTCYPNLRPSDGTNYLPVRLLYGTTERRSNPNIPAPSQQPRRNQNDPVTANSTDGGRCLGQQ